MDFEKWEKRFHRWCQKRHLKPTIKARRAFSNYEEIKRKNFEKNWSPILGVLATIVFILVFGYIAYDVFYAGRFRSHAGHDPMYPDNYDMPYGAGPGGY